MKFPVICNQLAVALAVMQCFWTSFANLEGQHRLSTLPATHDPYITQCPPPKHLGFLSASRERALFGML